MPVGDAPNPPLWHCKNAQEQIHLNLAVVGPVLAAKGHQLLCLPGAAPQTTSPMVTLHSSVTHAWVNDVFSFYHDPLNQKHSS